MRFSSRRKQSAALSSRSAGTANREKSAFRARNLHCRERTICPCVVYYQRGSMHDERDRAPETAPGDREVARSPFRAHREVVWCTRAVAPCPPFSLPHLRVARGRYRADPDVVIHSRLHSAERPLAACEIQAMERPLFSSVQTLEKCSRRALPTSLPMNTNGRCCP